MSAGVTRMNGCRRPCSPEPPSQAEEHGIDDQGYTTHPAVARAGRDHLRRHRLGDRHRPADLEGRPDGQEGVGRPHRQDPGRARRLAAAKRDAEAEAAQIRQSLGNIEAERQRLLAEADAQAEALLADGRARLDTEVAELEAKADADIAAGAGRAGDELRAEIARLAGAAPTSSSSARSTTPRSSS